MRTLLLSALLALILCATPTFATVTTWPLVLKGQKGTATVYTPQVESYTNGRIEGRGAVMVQRSSGGDPVFGAISFTATIPAEHSASVIPIDKVTVTDAKFPPSVTTGTISSFKQELSDLLTAAHITIGADLIERAEKNTPLKTDPPTILVRYAPAMLVLIDGEPRWKSIDNSSMERVVNTPFLLVRERGTTVLYLYGATKWYSAATIDGPWSVVNSPSASLKDLEKQMLEQMKKDGREAPTTPTTMPQVVVSTTPAELLSFNGEPAFDPITGTSLLGATNTESFVFMDLASQKYYTVLSGRWYKATKPAGPWSYVASTDLPVDFKKIPEGSKYDAVLAYVSGTAAAKNAILDATVPTTSAVDRATATCKVEYDGEPIFKPVDGTTMQYATNTASTVLKQGDQYYCCDNGVWFASTSAKGPWVVSEKRPEQTEKIEPSSPVYNTKYVYVYQSTPSVVYVGYTAGYMGSYVYGPTIVYGTGYYYYPWYGVHYYPHPYTYGFHMVYSPYMGWGVGVGYYGHYHGGYWGPHMYHPPYYGHHPPYGHYGGRPVNINVHNTNIYNNGARAGTRPMATPTQRPSTMPSAAQRPTQTPAQRPSSMPSASTRPTQSPAQMPAQRPSSMPRGGGGGRRR
jgi:hypothetical protein